MRREIKELDYLYKFAKLEDTDIDFQEGLKESYDYVKEKLNKYDEKFKIAEKNLNDLIYSKLIIKDKKLVGEKHITVDEASKVLGTLRYFYGKE